MTSPPVNERIAARRAEVRAARRRRRLRRTVTVLVVAMLTVGFLALERSSLVALADLEVTGLERLTREEVVAAAGVEVGTSVLRIRLGAVRDRVEAMPLVAGATVERVGAVGLRIDVVEAAPVLTAVYPAGPVLVGEGGRVLGPGTAPGTVEVTVGGPQPAPGSRVDDLPALGAAHDVVVELSGPLLAMLDTVRAVDGDDVRLLLDSGTEVRWGGADRGDEKARALGAVLEDLGARRVAVIDVRAPRAPTVSP